MSTSTENTIQVLGLVKNNVFRQLKPTPKPDVQARFTSIPPQGSMPPESGELDLTQYERRAIMIRGMEQGEWIYSAEVIDTAAPIFTAVVERLFSPPDQED